MLQTPFRSDSLFDEWISKDCALTFEEWLEEVFAPPPRTPIASAPEFNQPVTYGPESENYKPIDFTVPGATYAKGLSRLRDYDEGE